MERPLVRNRDISRIPDAVTAGTERAAPRGDSRSHADRCPERPAGMLLDSRFRASISVLEASTCSWRFPRARRVAALYSPEISGRAGFNALGAAAQSKGVTLQWIELRRADDLDSSLAAMGQARPTAMLAFAVRTDQLIGLVEITAKNRLPMVYAFREAVEAGGLISFGPESTDLWRGAANYVDISKHAGRVKSERVLL
jgi:hypothetical protein